MNEGSSATLTALGTDSLRRRCQGERDESGTVTAGGSARKPFLLAVAGRSVTRFQQPAG